MKSNVLNPAASPARNRTAAAFGLAAACFLLAAPSLRAENVIAMGFGDAARGARDVSVIVTASNDVPIHGFSLAFTYPSSALILTSVSTTGTQIDAVEPDLVAPSQDNQLGIGTLGVIFSFQAPIALKELAPLSAGAFPRIIARLTFDVKPGALAGVHELALRDGIGQPATYNVFTNRGTSIRPRLVNGSFSITGPGNLLALEKKLALPGVTPNLPILALARHPDPLAGFQIAIRYEKALDLKSVTYAGTELDFELGDRIEFYDSSIDPAFSSTHGRVQVGAVFDYDPLNAISGQTLPPSNASPPSQSLIKFTYSVGAGAGGGREYTELTLDNAGIPGLIDNRFFVGGEGVDPMLQHGKVYFSTGNLIGKVIDAVTGQGVAGVRIAADEYTGTTLANGSFRLSGVPPGNYSLFLTKTDYYPNRVMTTQGGTPIEVTGRNADTDVGMVPIYKVASITITPKPFLRGYINPDGRSDISDAIFLLAYLFQGGEKPRCRQTGDVNDDNKLDLSDPIWMLNYLFAGAARPRPPFSFDGTGCAFDPTPGGSLECVEFNFCK